MKLAPMLKAPRCTGKDSSASRVASMVPFASTTWNAWARCCPVWRVQFRPSLTHSIRTTISPSNPNRTTCVRGTKNNRRRESSLAIQRRLMSSRTASMSSGTLLNLSNEKRPEPGWDACTASGASSTESMLVPIDRPEL